MKNVLVIIFLITSYSAVCNDNFRFSFDLYGYHNFMRFSKTGSSQVFDVTVASRTQLNLSKNFGFYPLLSYTRFQYVSENKSNFYRYNNLEYGFGVWQDFGQFHFLFEIAQSKNYIKFRLPTNGWQSIQNFLVYRSQVSYLVSIKNFSFGPFLQVAFSSTDLSVQTRYSIQNDFGIKIVL